MDRRAEALGLLQKLISINSVFPHEAEIAHFARDYLASCGFDVALQEFSPGRFNVIAQKGPRQDSVLLCGHLDTVPPYNYGEHNPLQMREEGERVRGLGCWDMKSGFALILLSAKYCNVQNRGLRIVLTGDEENISEGTWFAQKNKEFSGCSIAIVPEIPDDSRGGQDDETSRPPLLIGRRGRSVYRFTVTGIGAHGASDNGVSAVQLGMRLVAALESIPMPSHAKMGPCRLFVRKFQSESRSLSVPTEAIIEADVHYVPPHTPQTFLEYIRQNLSSLKFPSGCGWSIEIPQRKTPYLPAYESNMQTPEAKRFLSSYESYLGKPEISYGLTVADENVLSVEKFPVITLGPAGGEAHSAKEWVSRPDFLLLSEKFPEIVQGMLD